MTSGGITLSLSPEARDSACKTSRSQLPTSGTEHSTNIYHDNHILIKSCYVYLTLKTAIKKNNEKKISNYNKENLFFQQVLSMNI